MTKPVVAHILPSYLPVSQTFIYRYLSKLRTVTPIILAGELNNLASFPVRSRLYDCSSHPYSLRWMIYGFGKRFLGDLDAYRRMILKLNRVKLLHAHFGPTGYDILMTKQRLKLPLITTFYGCDMSRLPRLKKWQDKYEELFDNGDLFLVEGNNMKRELTHLGCPPEKIKIQHIAIDTDQFRFRKRLPKSIGNVILLFCGRFTEKKGLIYALMALRHVMPQFPNIEFRIVGDGQLRSEVETYINENRMGDKVKLLGMMSHDAVVKEMEAADIFIQPSVTAKNGDTEGGAPTIILEAQSAGVPVLTTYHADIPEIVVPGKSALLSMERDSESLAENLMSLLSNQQKWIEMGKVGREHVERKHNIFREVIKLERIYYEILGLDIKNNIRKA
jgi:colanic acid/amylovoran biosynthesis glycosyltransferase